MSKNAFQNKSCGYFKNNNTFFFIGIPPEFLASPDENQYGVEGRTMRIIANIRAYPKPEVSWYMYGRKLQMGDRLTSSLTDKVYFLLALNL